MDSDQVLSNPVLGPLVKGFYERVAPSISAEEATLPLTTLPGECERTHTHTHTHTDARTHTKVAGGTRGCITVPDVWVVHALLLLFA